jgi:hypothetical protein
MLPVILYECESRPLTLKEESKLKITVFLGETSFVVGTKDSDGPVALIFMAEEN